MMVVQVVGEALGLVLGSLAVAALFCWLCWNGFKLVRHPELGVPLCLIASLWLWSDGLAHSPLLRLPTIYAGLAAFALWPAGLAWHRRHRSRSR